MLGCRGRGRARAREGDTAGGGAEGGDSVPLEGWNTFHLLACSTIRINWYSVWGGTQTQKCKPSTSFLISPPQDSLGGGEFWLQSGLPGGDGGTAGRGEGPRTCLSDLSGLECPPELPLPPPPSPARPPKPRGSGEGCFSSFLHHCSERVNSSLLPSRRGPTGAGRGPADPKSP